MGRTAPIAALDAVSYVREKRTILSEVSWRIDAGEHWALLGANGSGKTTLLKVLSGYAWPTSGRVAVLGETFGQTDLRALRTRIGWVSNAMSDRLPVNHTAREIVASGFDASMGLFRDIGAEEWQRCAESLERIGMARLAEQAFGTLSQGEQQRVRIARALVNQPSLLILDEPCVGLDPLSRDQFLRDLGRFAEEDGAPTIVYVTHHIEEIGEWIGWVLGLRDGRVVLRGTAADTLTSEGASDLFGLPLEVSQGKGRWWIRSGVR